MRVHQNTVYLVLSLMAVFFLSACGGGGDSAAPPPPPPPLVTTDIATNITNVGATLNGTVNPNGLAAEAWFEWGTSPTLSTCDNTAKQPFAARTSFHLVTAPLPGLTFGTTYYFRLVASNSSGETRGTIKNFNTSTLRPTVTTLAADYLSTTSATLHGEVNPNSSATQAWFEYGTDIDLTTFTPTAHVPVGSGSSVVSTSANISDLAPGGIVYFRVAASNAVGEQKGTILSVDMGNPLPVANAGSDTIVEMGQTVTLDGSGSRTPIGTITSYLWTQVAGTPVILSDITAVNPTFTVPTVPVTGDELRFQLTVTDSRSLSASDSVDITVKWVGFADDFGTDTTGTYTAVPTLGDGGAFTWDSAGKRAQITSGNDKKLKISKSLPGRSSGAFSVDFSPTTPYITHGGIWVRLVQDANNYYEIKNFEYESLGVIAPFEPDFARVRKIVGGVAESLDYTMGYLQGGTYNIKITFSPTQVILEGFGPPVTLNTANTTAISVTGFEIETGQQDAYYDNIKLMAHP